jgi:hypothetical protein
MQVITQVRRHSGIHQDLVVFNPQPLVALSPGFPVPVRNVHCGSQAYLTYNLTSQCVFGVTYLALLSREFRSLQGSWVYTALDTTVGFC